MLEKVDVVLTWFASIEYDITDYERFEIMLLKYIISVLRYVWGESQHQTNIREKHYINDGDIGMNLSGHSKSECWMRTSEMFLWISLWVFTIEKIQ